MSIKRENNIPGKFTSSFEKVTDVSSYQSTIDIKITDKSQQNINSLTLKKQDKKFVQKKFQVAYPNKNQQQIFYPDFLQKQSRIKKINSKLQPQDISNSVQYGDLQINSTHGSFKLNKNDINEKRAIKSKNNVFSINKQQVSFLLPMNQKMTNLQNKSNKLIEKVLAIQEQIQKFAQNQQKQLRHYGIQIPDGPLLQTKSVLLKKKQFQQMDFQMNQHQQSIRKMNILGKNKVKMIEDLQNQIDTLQRKCVKQPQIKQKIIENQNDVQNLIQEKFETYHKHKNDILKQSRSQKFSFKSFKYLSKKKKQERSQIQDKIQEVQNIHQQDQSTQLKNLKNQFDLYQQRTKRQLQSYKQKLSKTILQKENLKKQLDKMKFQFLQEKLFGKNKNFSKNMKVSTQQKTSRQMIEIKQSRVSQFGENDTDNYLRIPKTERLNNYQEINDLQDLEEFKDQLSVKYMRQNHTIIELNQRIKQLEDINSDLQHQIESLMKKNVEEQQKNKVSFEEKQKIIQKLSQLNEQKDRQIQELCLEINDMSNYIMQSKQENQNQSQALEEYKIVVQEFVQEVTNLRSQITQKNCQNSLLEEQLEEASKINSLCQEEINKLQKVNQKLKAELNSFIKRQNLIKQAGLVPKNMLKTDFKQNISLTISSEEIIAFKKQYNIFLQQKQSRIQELEQNLESLKSSLDDQVDQQVNQGIRTFLRYRKHSNHLVNQTLRVIIYSNKTLTTQRFGDQLIDLKFSNIKLSGNKNKMMTCRPKLSKSLTESFLTLRKLIQNKFNSKINSFKQCQLPLKIHLTVKLIKFALQMLNQEDILGIMSSKSLKSSQKKLPSLHPQNIRIVQTSSISEAKIDSIQVQNVSLQDKLRRLQIDYLNYAFIYQGDDKRQEDEKKDKSLIYLSPQVLLSMNESEASYCWSLGIIIDEIFCNRPYYIRLQQIVSRKENFKYEQKLSYPVHISQNLKQVLQKMLKKNLKQRPSLKFVLQKFQNLVQQT